MIRKIREFAAEAGLGIASTFAFLQIPSINENFTPEAMIIIRQTLIMGFSLCLMLNPKKLILLGKEFAPYLINFLKLFIPNKDEN